MTLPKKSNCCPVCYKVYTAMSNHLRTAHRVANLQERRLLLNLATRRVYVRDSACPVLGCTYKSKRLDRHLIESHPDLSKNEVENHMDAVKVAKTLALLAALRATNPSPMMATTLDLEGEEEGDEVRIPEKPQEGGAATCTAQDCISRLQSYCEASKKLKEQNQKLEKELSTVRRRYKQLDKKYRRLSNAAGLVREAGYP